MREAVAPSGGQPRLVLAEWGRRHGLAGEPRHGRQGTPAVAAPPNRRPERERQHPGAALVAFRLVPHRTAPGEVAFRDGVGLAAGRVLRRREAQPALLSRFDAGYPFLDHMRVVAASRDLSAMRAAMAGLLREETFEATAPADERKRRRDAKTILSRGLGC